MQKVLTYSTRPMFNTKKLIEQKVMEVVRAKIENGQREYEEVCERLDNEVFQKKVDAADRIVESIIR